MALCCVAVWNDPVRYIRRMLERISVTEEMAECWNKWAGYATARIPYLDLVAEDIVGHMHC